MGSVARDIFKAVHEQKWLSVEYRNRHEQVTHYWIGVNAIDPIARRLEVDGLHLRNHTLKRLTLSFDSIIGSSVVEGSFHHTPPSLLKAIESNDRFEALFGTVPNLKILDYLYDCARLNCTPYLKRFSLITRLDEDSFAYGALHLDDEQFKQMVRYLQSDARKRGSQHGRFYSRQIGLNVLSLRSKKGLYVLAYRELRLDVKHRVLALGRNTILCREFSVSDGKVHERHAIRFYLDESDFPLLDDFTSNAERIRDCVMERCGASVVVDDEPHVFEVRRNTPTYLQDEYDAITDMCNEERATYPIRAFFGNLVRRPIRRKEYPLSLVNQHANLDQLLAISQGIKYPLTYVQGPPGTGKTSTIENLLVNAFCNGLTVLFASYNNHPVDGVFSDLRRLACDDMAIPFPILRLGNQQRVAEALDDMRELYQGVKDLTVPRNAPRWGGSEGTERAKTVAALLKEYERQVDLRERRDCICMLAESNDNLNFSVELKGRQLAEIDAQLGDMQHLDALFERVSKLTGADHDALMRYLLGASLFRIQLLGKPRNATLLDIVMSEDSAQSRVERFNKYISDPKNLKELQRIFPVIATTCISARRLGPPSPSFSITVIDEASQCDTATALIPIVRGKNLVLVGDPQQLNPVVVMDRHDNEALRRAYQVTDEYDYIENSVYKTFLASDSVSNEILLHRHYRCDERIIDFNNQKYYAGKLQIETGRRLPQALEFVDVEHDSSPTKNAAPLEADVVTRYALEHPDQDIGIITPFANQRDLIQSSLELRGVSNATCGTVHTYQGDEKDVILFSLALTDRTRPGTYK